MSPSLEDKLCNRTRARCPFFSESVKCSVCFRPRGGSIAPANQTRGASAVFKSSITASTNSVSETLASVSVYKQWMVPVKQKQDMGLSHCSKNAFIVGKICYCYYTYFVKGAAVTDVSM